MTLFGHFETFSRKKLNFFPKPTDNYHGVGRNRTPPLSSLRLQLFFLLIWDFYDLMLCKKIEKKLLKSEILCIKNEQACRIFEI